MEPAGSPGTIVAANSLLSSASFAPTRQADKEGRAKAGCNKLANVAILLGELKKNSILWFVATKIRIKVSKQKIEMALSQPMYLQDPKVLSSELVGFITSEEVSQEQRARFSEGSVKYWNEHVNPGFLQYRKSVSDDFAVVEWSGSGSILKAIYISRFMELFVRCFNC